ncbi:ROK family protein [Patescibacteria group bacterium]|nr:ROK family protein [Patescibacteria group bacterium]
MFISIDVGGTNTRLASTKNLKDIKEYRTFSTPKDFSLGIKKITNAIEEMALQSQIKAIIIGLPGVIDREKQKLVKAPNLKNWVNKPIVDLLSKKFKCRTLLENDTALGGLGEAVFGAGKKYQIIAYLTLGTGLGGARIVNKKIDQSAQGFEPGHQIVKINGKQCSCGQKGCLEAYISSKAFYQKYKTKPESCTNTKIWAEFSQKFGQGLVNVIALWSPNIVIIGGGFSKKGEMLFNLLKKFVKQNLRIFKTPPIVKSTLCDKSGIYGGFYYLKTHIK